MTSFYQNYRPYIRSYIYAQLAGTDQTTSYAGAYCDPVTHIGDLYKYQISALNLTDNSTYGNIANPCGWMAKSVFNDTISLSQGGVAIPIDRSDISWSVDRNSKFKKSKAQAQWIDVTNQDFINWMQIATTSTWKKLWAKVNQPLPAGTYSLDIVNNYDVSAWQGSKYIVVSDVSSIGGKSTFVGALILACGLSYLVVIAAVAFLMYRFNNSPQKKYPKIDFKWE